MKDLFGEIRRSLKVALYSLMLTSVEAFIAVVTLISSVPILFNPEELAPGSILALLPGWAVYPWAIGMALGGVLSLGGILLVEYRIERMGVALLTCVTAIYALALTPLLLASVIPLVTYFLASLAMAGRWWVLGHHLKLQEAYLEQIIRANIQRQQERERERARVRN